MKKQNLRKIMNGITIVSMVALLFLVICGIQTKLFYSEKELAAFLGQFGIWAPIVFIVFQAVQVIFPVLPGGIGCLGGVLIFGPVKGFVFNYIGICIGSIAAFLIAKQFGMRIIELIFSNKLQKKYASWVENKKFTRMFAVAIFMPVAPDDFLCYLAGTTKMTLQSFTAIILVGKPLAIAAYSFGLNIIWKNITVLI